VTTVPTEVTCTLLIPPAYIKSLNNETSFAEMFGPWEQLPGEKEILCDQGRISRRLRQLEIRPLRDQTRTILIPAWSRALMDV